MRLIVGCGSITPPSRSNVTQTTPSAIARPERRHSIYVPRWNGGLLSVIWSCIRRRRGWCTARMMIDGETILTTALTFWGTRFDPGGRRTGGESTLSTSVLRSATKLRKRCAERCEAGRCTTEAISRSRIWRGCSTRWFRAGSTTSPVSTRLRSIPRCATWTWYWPAGRSGNTRNCVGIFDELGTGWRALRNPDQRCLLTGSSCRRRLDNGSGVSREAHAPFCESVGVRLPCATHLVLGFEHEAEAKRFLEELRTRLQEYSLSLHPDKTRLIEFG